MLRLWKTSLCGVAAALTLAGAACSDDGGSSSDESDGEAVQVAMKDWELSLDRSSVPAGAIAFDVSNEGPTTHEFEIFSGDVDPSSLPVENGVANTEGLQIVDEVEDVTAGSTAELAVELEAGTYALICNLPDHYAEGMFATLTVE